MKCFIGVIDIGSQISDWKHGFQKLGIDSITVGLNHMNSMQRNNVDYKIDKMFPLKFWPGVRPRILQAYMQDRVNPAKNYVFKKALKECDVFIYIFQSLYKHYRDFEIIRDKGKKLVYIFTGGHERWYHAAKQEYLNYRMTPLEIDAEHYATLSHLEKSLDIVRNVEKYANCIWSLPEQSQLLFRPYYRFNIPIDAESYLHKSIQRKVPVIIHAPSSPTFKGTKYVLEAIDILKRKGVKFEFQLIHNVPHNITIERLKACDIIVNQLLVPGGGKLALEGMALGKVMLTFQGYEYNYDQKTPEDCPIVDVDPFNLADRLKKIIEDLPLRSRLAEAGPEYIRKYHNPEKSAFKLLENIEDKNLNPEFRPSFFRNQFIPESQVSIDVYNKWTKYVKNCDWYKDIKPGERDGLIF